MKINGIICVPDLLRGVRGFPEGFFDLVREPIRQGTSINICQPPDSKRSQGFAPGFDIAKFRTLTGINIDDFSNSMARQSHWSATYHQIPEAAVEYLFDHLPAHHLLLSFEIPYWLAHACLKREVAFLDLRPSPLRFGRDLYMALRCSNVELTQRIALHAVQDDELHLEAGLLGANVRMHKLRMESERGFRFEDLENSLLFVGQAPYDASLLAPTGRSLRCTDYADALHALSQGRRLFHKPHPFALEFAKEEREALRSITGQDPQHCQQNAYQILSSEEDIVLSGISSGLLQEAPWFQKLAHSLYQPFVPLAKQGTSAPDAYQQIRFQTFLAPAFWHQLITPERSAPQLATLPALAHNHARETIDQWWDYSKVITWERALPYESVTRNGGATLRQRIEKLENSATNVTHVEQKNHSNSKIDLEPFQALTAALYLRLSKTYKDTSQAIATNTAHIKYQQKSLDANYYQELHDNNILFQKNNWLLPHLNILRSKNFSCIREVGCGNGAFISEIAKHVHRAIGMDWAASPLFPIRDNIEFVQEDLTVAMLEHVELNCSADVLEHIAPEKIPQVINKLHQSAHFNFHVIACYDDGHSHLSIMPPDAWLSIFRQNSENYKIADISIRRNNIEQIVCVITNFK